MTQAEALELLKLGRNVFLTGAAGSGKTYVLNTYIKYLREHGVGVAITASTGIAATHIGGQTIHSWSGMGVRDALADDEIEKLAKNDRIKRNFKNVKVLVIDEVSMLHAHQLDLVDRITRVLLDFTKPFGGLQVVLCGDFFQLPPVSRGEQSRFAFESRAWQDGDFTICYLSEQYRQQDQDDALLSVLSAIRRGIFSGDEAEEVKQPLRSRYKKDPEGAVPPTRLYARNINVDSINERELVGLNAEEKRFAMDAKGLKQLVEGLKKSCLAPEELVLKVGAKVMFVKNDPEGRFVNGTLGHIELFDPEDGWPIVRTLEGGLIQAEPHEWRLEEDGVVRAMLTQVPLRLAWAITIHKSQGMTLDAAEIDLSDAFEPGMGYVALSRVRSLRGLKLMGLNDTALRVNQKVREFDSILQDASHEAAHVLGAFEPSQIKAAQEDTLIHRFGGSKDAKRWVAPTQFVGKKKEKKKPSFEETKELLEEGRSLKEIAKRRSMALTTIIGHLEKLKALDELPDITHVRPSEKDFKKMADALQQTEELRLTPAKQKVGSKYSFEDLRITRLFL
jgi:ATP-dependent exoDNAse (exonuclease V) alpha subunit